MHSVEHLFETVVLVTVFQAFHINFLTYDQLYTVFHKKWNHLFSTITLALIGRIL